MALRFRKGDYPVFDVVAPTGGFTAYTPVKMGGVLVIPQTDAAMDVLAACHIPGVCAQWDGAIAGATFSAG